MKKQICVPPRKVATQPRDDDKVAAVASALGVDREYAIDLIATCVASTNWPTKMVVDACEAFFD